MPGSSLYKGLETIQRLGTAILNGEYRHYGIITDPHTGKLLNRPDAVGDIRLIEFKVSKSSGLEPIAIALDILYKDFLNSTLSLLIKRRRSSLRTTNGAVLHVIKRNTIDSILRPIAAQVEGNTVRIWAEVDPIANGLYQNKGQFAFGPKITSEPKISKNAIIYTGHDLDEMVTASQARLKAERARRAAEQQARKRSHHRKVWLTTSFVSLILAMSIGATFLGSLLITALAICMIGILFYSRVDRSWTAVELWLQATNEIQPGIAQTKIGQQSIWAEIEGAVNNHAPEKAATLKEARISIERLSTISENCTDPHIHSRITTTVGGVKSLVEAYRKPVRLALEQEAHELTLDLITSISALAISAETIRTDMLKAARNEFDTERQYLNTRSESGDLSPIL